MGIQSPSTLASVPKDGREGLANMISVRMVIRIDPCEWSDLIIRFSNLFSEQ